MTIQFLWGDRESLFQHPCGSIYSGIQWSFVRLTSGRRWVDQVCGHPVVERLSTAPWRQGSTGRFLFSSIFRLILRIKVVKMTLCYNNAHALRLTLPITSVYTCFSGTNWNDNRCGDYAMFPILKHENHQRSLRMWLFLQIIAIKLTHMRIFPHSILRKE